MKLKPGPAATIRTFPHKPLMRERSPPIFRSGRLGFVFAEQFDVAAQGNGREEIFGFADLATENLRAEPEGEFQDLDADPAGRQKVPELMERDKDAEDDQEPPGFLHQDNQRVSGDQVNANIMGVLNI